MAQTELNPKNYRRISAINWLLSPPLALLFAWPYHIVVQFLEINRMLGYLGTLLFSLAFTLTILHGHVTMALGSLHRQHYYDWLGEHALSYGLFFHPLLISTRFRLILAVSSIVAMAAGSLVTL